MEGWESDPDAWKKAYEKSVEGWKKLDDHLKIAEGWLEYLVKNPSQNHQIKHSDYLMPEMWTSEIPVKLTDLRGAFIYFIRIRNVLRKAKQIGYFPESELPEDAPSWLEEFAR